MDNAVIESENCVISETYVGISKPRKWNKHQFQVTDSLFAFLIPSIKGEQAFSFITNIWIFANKQCLNKQSTSFINDNPIYKHKVQGAKFCIIR